MSQKFIVSRDDNIYEAWPDVTLTPSGKLACVFSECTHHCDRSYTRIMLAISSDRGRTWTPKRPLTNGLRGNPKIDPYWNCARIVTLGDGRLVVIVDRIRGEYGNKDREQSNWLWLSGDEGETWVGPQATPVVGIVPDKLIELKHGRHIGRRVMSAHAVLEINKKPVWAVRCWLSDDQGKNWSGPKLIAAEPGLELCEGSIVELPRGELVCFMRENSFQGLDAFKSISKDGGITWEGPYKMPIPACHRPVAGLLSSGKVLISYRFMQGGKGWGWRFQNFFVAITDTQSCITARREDAQVRIMPLDYDIHPEADTGYSGWVQFADGEIYLVNYIMDDAPKAQIRGYAFFEDEIIRNH